MRQLGRNRADLKALLIIATTTFLTALRARLLLLSMLFALLLLGLGMLLAAVSLGERVRLVIDVSLGSLSLLGSLLAAGLLIFSLALEIANHTAYPVLVRPLSRRAWLLGKYLGNLGALWLVLTIMGLLSFLAIISYGEWPPLAFGQALTLIYIELALVMALALVLALISSPLLAASYTLGLWLIGNLASDLRELLVKLESSKPLVAKVAGVVYYLLPNLSFLSLRGAAANALVVPWRLWLLSMLYGLVYTALLLVLAVEIFKRRNTI